MRTFKRVLMAALALVILLGGLGAAQPAQAAGCAFWHMVQYGQSLSWIGRYYNVYWPAIAQANGIGNPRWIYAGQVLCIPAGGGWVNPGPWNPPVSGGQPGGYRTWSFTIRTVDPNTSVTIDGRNLPSDVRLNVRMGKPANNGVTWTDLGDLDTAGGGNQSYQLVIPAALQGTPQLRLRITQAKKNGRVFQQDLQFYTAGGPTGGYPGSGWNYPPYYYSGVPTIWIVGVQRDSSVRVSTNNFPPNLNFDVRMNVMGTQGLGGFYVETFNSGVGGSFVRDFAIPPALYGQPQIAIRTDNFNTGFYSYNWFYNNTTY